MVIMLPLERKEKKKERKNGNLKKKQQKNPHNSLMCEFLRFYNLGIEMHFLPHRGILNI